MVQRLMIFSVMVCGSLLLSACVPAGFRDASLESASEWSPLVGKPAPEVEGKLLNGSVFRLNEHRSNNVVMLDFWASWCEPCVMELPVLMKLADEYASRGVVLYAVNSEDDPADIREFLQNRRWSLNVVLDPSRSSAGAYEVSGIPQLVLIDRHGIVRRVHVGYHPDAERILRGELDELLTQTVSTPPPSPQQDP